MKRYSFRFALMLMALMFCAVGAFAETSFRLLPVGDAIQGRRFRIIFELNTDDQDILESVSSPSPQRVELDGCKLYSGPGTTVSQQSSFVNGRSYSSCSVQYTYIYMAEKEGKVTVPSVSIKAGNKTYKTKPQTFNVVKDNTSSQHQGSTNHQSVQGGASQPSTGNISVGKVTSKDLMVNISFSKSHVYEQEPVIATIKLYLRYDGDFTIDGSTFKAIKLPVFDGFLSEDLPVTQGNKIENYNGQVYNTWEIKRVLLFPQKDGRLTVNSGQYEITVLEYEWITYGFMRTRREVPRTMSTATNTAVIQVDKLPQPQPIDFSGAVGSFSISSELTPDILRTNEVATYSLIIKGAGNIKYLTIPDVEFPSTFDKYTSKTDIKADFNGSTYTGTYRIDYPFVPQEIGKFTIPAKQFVYFDPSTKKYVTIEAKGYDVNVARGTASNVSTLQKSVDAAMDDILHIHSLPSNITPANTPIVGKMSYWALYIVTLFGLIIAIIVYRRNIKRSADVAGRRLARANRVATKRFKTAAAFMKSHKSEQFYEELARALKGYIGDKLGISPSQLISDTIVEKLTAFGATTEDATEVVDVLNDCEMARFTPSQSDSAMSDIYNRASAAIKVIENVKSK